VLAVAIADPGSASSSGKALPEPAGAPDGSWYTALAGVARASVAGRSDCGYRITRRTLGIAHPVLPCGARLYVLYAGTQALTQVVDRGPTGAGRELDLTPALARRLHLRGIQRIQWAYARG
jgi:rare lipoprotein A (peptidoglycan hydrolase)